MKKTILFILIFFLFALVSFIPQNKTSSNIESATSYLIDKVTENDSLIIMSEFVFSNHTEREIILFYKIGKNIYAEVKFSNMQNFTTECCKGQNNKTLKLKKKKIDAIRHFEANTITNSLEKTNLTGLKATYKFIFKKEVMSYETQYVKSLADIIMN